MDEEEKLASGLGASSIREEEDLKGTLDAPEIDLSKEVWPELPKKEEIIYVMFAHRILSISFYLVFLVAAIPLN